MNENDEVKKYLYLVGREVEKLERLSLGIDAAAMRSAGMAGLLRAIRIREGKGDPALFYSQKVRWYILDEIRRFDVLTRRDRIKKKLIDRATHELEEELGRVPTENEIRERLKLSPKLFRLWKINTSQRPPLSINSPAFRLANKTDLSECIADLRGKDAEEEEDRVRLLLTALAKLPAIERTILHEHFFAGRKLHEIGRKHGFTESRASQIQSRGISRLRAEIKATAYSCV